MSISCDTIFVLVSKYLSLWPWPYLEYIWKKAWSFIWTYLNPLYPRICCAKFGLNWFYILDDPWLFSILDDAWLLSVLPQHWCLNLFLFPCLRKNKFIFCINIFACRLFLLPVTCTWRADTRKRVCRKCICDCLHI